jgi:hypothetical protein
VKIAVVTGPRQVLLHAASAVLPGHNMFHMKSVEPILCLRQMTVLATILGPFSDGLSERGIH